MSLFDIYTPRRLLLRLRRSTASVMVKKLLAKLNTCADFRVLAKRVFGGFGISRINLLSPCLGLNNSRYFGLKRK